MKKLSIYIVIFFFVLSSSTVGKFTYAAQYNKNVKSTLPSILYLLSPNYLPVNLIKVSRSNVVNIKTLDSVVIDNVSFDSPLKVRFSSLGNFTIEYNQNNGKVSFFITDNNRVYAPSYIYFDILNVPMDLVSYASDKSSIVKLSNNINKLAFTTTIFITFLGATIIIPIMAKTGVDVINNAIEVHEFHVNNVVYEDIKERRYISTIGGLADEMIAEAELSLGVFAFATSAYGYLHALGANSLQIIAKDAGWQIAADTARDVLLEALLKYFRDRSTATLNDSTEIEVRMYRFPKLFAKRTSSNSIRQYGWFMEIRIADVDQDGSHSTIVTGGTDCNDLDPLVNPDSEEVCDSVDNNCDGQVDEGCTLPQDFTYSNNGNGTVTQNETGLMWQKSDSNETHDVHEAIEYCENLKLAGYSDWRLPTKDELKTLVECSNGAPTPLQDPYGEPYTCNSTYSYGPYDRPTISSIFIPTAHDYKTRYWSSTRYEDTSTQYWGVSYYSGRSYWLRGHEGNMARCVR